MDGEAAAAACAGAVFLKNAPVAAHGEYNFVLMNI